MQGMSKKEIAECLGIGYSTFREKINQNSGTLALFRKVAICKKDTIKNQIEEVEKSLYERAKGFDEEKTYFIKVKSKGVDDNGNSYEREEVLEKKAIEHTPADIQAAKFFLINMSKRVWQDNPHKVENDRESLKIKQKESERNDF